MSLNHVSLNQWIAVAVAEKVGVIETAADFFKKARWERHGRRSYEVFSRRSQNKSRTGRQG